MRLNCNCPFCSKVFYMDNPKFTSECFCPFCKNRLSDLYSLATSDSDITIASIILSDELNKDVAKLLEMGIYVEKGKVVTQAGGAVGVGVSAYAGSWIGIIASVVATLAAEALGESIKKVSFQEFQVKWFITINKLSEKQKIIFLTTLKTRYPLISTNLPLLLSPNMKIE